MHDPLPEGRTAAATHDLSARAMAPILWTEKLAKSFGGIHAVQNLDFSMNEGEIVAIIGPNGSGKTTFFNLIMQLYEATSGAIFFGPERRNLVGMQTHEIHRLGIARTFQTLRLLPNLTVLENVLVGMSRHASLGFWRSLARPRALKLEERNAEEAALETLSFFGSRLLSMCNEPAHSLSYANRRRLEIARAMGSEPKLILLDEPAAGMNPTETREVMLDIKGLNARGFTVLLIEHDMTLVKGLASRVVAFDHGTKIAEGSFDEVSSNSRVIEAYLGRRASSLSGWGDSKS
jgi:ABC-type branched-subunit amino acid transport system ATPase component